MKDKAAFKVLLVDQRKMIRRLLSLVIPYLIVTPLCLGIIANLNVQKSIFISIIIAFVVAFPIVLYLILKSTNSKETILLNEQFVSTNAFGLIEFKNIRSIKLKSYNAGSGVELTLDSGFKIIILPSNQFSSLSAKVVGDFYRALINNYNQINSSNKIT